MRCYRIWSTEDKSFYTQPQREDRPSRSNWDSKSQAKRLGTQIFGAKKFKIVTFKMVRSYED